MWFPLAVSAAAFWGVSYALSEWLYRHISVLTLLTIEFFTATLVFGALSLWKGAWHADLATLSDTKPFWYLAGCITTLIIGELAINFAIEGKNASIASLIEISYPFFVIAASYFIFRDTHINTATAFGGALIFSGVALIYLFNR